MISFPFDSQIIGTDEAGLPIYDRASNSEDLAKWFASFFTNGIFASSGFAVTVSGLTVSVAPGDCLINGRYGYEKGNRTFTIAGGGSQPRIDTVVLRLDMSLNARKIDLYIKAGTAAASPVAPTLTRDDIMWELGIANIRVDASKTSVNQSAVTDTRLDSNRCGIVAQAMKTIDTSSYYRQIQAALDEFKANEQADFEAWFESIKGVLDGDVAANFAGMIADLQTQMPTNSKPLPVSRGGTEATTPEGARNSIKAAGLDDNGKVIASQASSAVQSISQNTTLALKHAGCMLRVMTNSSVITIPPSSTVNFPVGTELEILRWGAEIDVSITSASDVYLAGDGKASKGRTISIGSNFGVVALKKVSDAYWLAVGDFV